MIRQKTEELYRKHLFMHRFIYPLETPGKTTLWNVYEENGNKEKRVTDFTHVDRMALPAQLGHGASGDSCMGDSV